MPQEPNQTPAPTRPISPLVGSLVVIALVAACALAWLYVRSMPGPTPGTFIPPMYMGQSEEDSAVEEAEDPGSFEPIGEFSWVSIIGAKPIRTVPVRYFGESGDSTAEERSVFELYVVGVFTKGRYAGDVLVVARNKWQNQSSVQTPSNFGGGDSGYFIAKPDGTPVASWGYNATYIEGMGDSSIPTTFKFDAIPKLASTTLSTALRYVYPRQNIDYTYTQFSGLELPEPVPYEVQAGTVQGNLIVRRALMPSDSPDRFGALLQPYAYYVQYPFGALESLETMPNFFGGDSYSSLPPSLSWSAGSTDVSTYSYAHYSYGWFDCFYSIASRADFEASVVLTGRTFKGDPLFEVAPAGHDDIYQCLYQKTKRYDYSLSIEEPTSYYPQTYAEFLATHPVFFWKHPTGDYMGFARTDVVPAAEKAKPVIYLYTTRTQEVSVAVDPIGGFTKTDPAYGSGWRVRATPQGLLTNLADDRTYPYLFWEGGKEGAVATPKEGFVVKQDDIAAVLKAKLALLGLNAQERADFLEFWVPRLTQAPYYFITFVSRSEIDRVAPLTITPKPDTVIRVLMDYSPLAAPVHVAPLAIRPTARHGFTVVEWGGIIR